MDDSGSPNSVVELRRAFESLSAPIRRAIEFVVFGGDLPRADVSRMRWMAEELRAKACVLGTQAEDLELVLAQEDSLGAWGDRMREVLQLQHEGTARLCEEARLLADQADGAANDAEKTLVVMLVFGIDLAWRVIRTVSAAAAAGPAAQVAAAPAVDAMLVEGQARVALMRAGLEQAYRMGAAKTAAQVSALGPRQVLFAVARAAALPAGVDFGTQLAQVALGDRIMSAKGPNGVNPRGLDLTSVAAAAVSGAGGALGGMAIAVIAPKAFPRLESSRVVLGLLQGFGGAVSGLGAAAFVTGWPEHGKDVLAALLSGGLGGMTEVRGGANAGPTSRTGTMIDGGGEYVRPDSATARLSKDAVLGLAGAPRGTEAVIPHAETAITAKTADTARLLADSRAVTQVSVQTADQARPLDAPGTSAHIPAQSADSAQRLPEHGADTRTLAQEVHANGRASANEQASAPTLPVPHNDPAVAAGAGDRSDTNGAPVYGPAHDEKNAAPTAEVGDSGDTAALADSARAAGTAHVDLDPAHLDPAHVDPDPAHVDPDLPRVDGDAQAGVQVSGSAEASVGGEHSSAQPLHPAHRSAAEANPVGGVRGVDSRPVALAAGDSARATPQSAKAESLVARGTSGRSGSGAADPDRVSAPEVTDAPPTHPATHRELAGSTQEVDPAADPAHAADSVAETKNHPIAAEHPSAHFVRELNTELAQLFSADPTVKADLTAEQSAQFTAAAHKTLEVYHLRQEELAAESWEQRRAAMEQGDRAEALLRYLAAVREGTGLTPRWNQIKAFLLGEHGFMRQMGTGQGKSLVGVLDALGQLSRGQATELPSGRSVRVHHVITTTETLANDGARQGAAMFHSLGYDCARWDPQHPPADPDRPTVYYMTYNERATAQFDHPPPGTTATMDEADALLVHDQTVHYQSDGQREPASDVESAAVHRVRDFLRDLLRDRVLTSADLRADRESSFATAGRRWEERTGRPFTEQEAAGARIFLEVKAGRFKLNRDFQIFDGKVQLLDEYGKPRSDPKVGTDSRLLGGGHQMLEAMFRLEVYSDGTGSKVVTVEDVANSYDRLLLMSGTLERTAAEIKENFPVQGGLAQVEDFGRSKLVGEQDRIFVTEPDKLKDAVARVQQLQAEGRPVLVICPYNDVAAKFSLMLGKAGVAHTAIDARWFAEHRDNNAAEEDLLTVKDTAGDKAAVTVGTGMLGRGFDVSITDEVNQLGGVHAHMLGRAARNPDEDHQWASRAGRNGRNGSYCFNVAASDALYRQTPLHGAKIAVTHYRAAVSEHTAATVEHAETVRAAAEFGATHQQAQAVHAARAKLAAADADVAAATREMRSLTTTLQNEGADRAYLERAMRRADQAHTRPLAGDPAADSGQRIPAVPPTDTGPDAATPGQHTPDAGHPWAESDPAHAATDVVQPHLHGDRFARLSSWLGVPAAAQAAAAFFDTDDDDDPLSRLLERAGVATAAVAAMNQHLDHVPPASIMRTADLTDRQALEYLAPQRDRLISELGVEATRFAGAEGVRTAGALVEAARAELANLLGLPQAEVNAATARGELAAALTRVLTPSETADGLVADNLVAAASLYLASAALLDLTVAIHQRSPKSCVNNGVAMMRVLHPDNESAYRMPADEPLRGHDRADTQRAFGGSLREFDSLDKAAESLADRPRGSAALVYKWLNNGRVESHLVLLFNDSDRADAPNVVVLDIAAAPGAAPISPADLAAPRALLRKAVPFEQWRRTQQRFIDALDEAERRVSAIEFDSKGVPLDLLSPAQRTPVTAPTPSTAPPAQPSSRAPPLAQADFGLAGHRPPSDGFEAHAPDLPQLLHNTWSRLHGLRLIRESEQSWRARLAPYAFEVESTATRDPHEPLAVGVADGDVHDAGVGTPQWALHHYVTTGRPPEITSDLEVDLPTHPLDIARGKWLKDLRLEQRRTQQEVAGAAGLTNSALSNIEKGRRTAPATFEQICHALGVEGEALTAAIRWFYPEVAVDAAVAVPPVGWLAEQRIDRGLSTEELARAAGVTPQRIERIEAGETPTPKLFFRIARELAVDDHAATEEARQRYPGLALDSDPTAHDRAAPGGWLAARRYRLGTSQAAIAAAAGISPGYLAGIESGEHVPASVIFRRICRVLDVTPTDLASATHHFYPDLILDPRPTAHDPAAAGSWIVALRHDRDLTRPELATAIGPDWGRLDHIETQTYAPRFAVFRRICEALAVDSELLRAATRHFYPHVDVDLVLAPHEIGAWVTALRNDRDVSRAELSRLSGLSTRYLALIENENQHPTFETFRSICRALGVSGGALIRAAREFYPELTADIDPAAHRTLGGWVAALRNDQRMTPTDLARRARMAPRSLFSIENDDYPPSLRELRPLCEALGVGGDVLVEVVEKFYGELYARSADRDEQELFERYLRTRMRSPEQRQMRQEILERFAWIPKAIAGRQSADIRNDVEQVATIAMFTAIVNHVPSGSFIDHAWASCLKAAFRYRLALRFPGLDQRTLKMVSVVEAQLRRMPPAEAKLDSAVARATGFTEEDVAFARGLLYLPGGHAALPPNLADRAGAGYARVDFAETFRAALADMSDPVKAEQLVVLRHDEGKSLSRSAAQLGLAADVAAKMYDEAMARLRGTFDVRNPTAGGSAAKRRRRSPWSGTRKPPRTPGSDDFIGSRPSEPGDAEPERNSAATPWSRHSDGGASDVGAARTPETAGPGEVESAAPPDVLEFLLRCFTHREPIYWREPARDSALAEWAWSSDEHLPVLTSDMPLSPVDMLVYAAVAAGELSRERVPAFYNWRDAEDFARRWLPELPDLLVPVGRRRLADGDPEALPGRGDVVLWYARNPSTGVERVVHVAVAEGHVSGETGSPFVLSFGRYCPWLLLQPSRGAAVMSGVEVTTIADATATNVDWLTPSRVEYGPGFWQQPATGQRLSVPPSRAAHASRPFNKKNWRREYPGLAQWLVGQPDAQQLAAAFTAWELADGAAGTRARLAEMVDLAVSRSQREEDLRTPNRHPIDGHPQVAVTMDETGTPVSLHVISMRGHSRILRNLYIDRPDLLDSIRRRAGRIPVSYGRAWLDADGVVGTTQMDSDFLDSSRESIPARLLSEYLALCSEGVLDRAGTGLWRSAKRPSFTEWTASLPSSMVNGPDDHSGGLLPGRMRTDVAIEEACRPRRPDEPDDPYSAMAALRRIVLEVSEEVVHPTLASAEPARLTQCSTASVDLGIARARLTVGKDAAGRWRVVAMPYPARDTGSVLAQWCAELTAGTRRGLLKLVRQQVDGYAEAHTAERPPTGWDGFIGSRPDDSVEPEHAGAHKDLIGPVDERAGLPTYVPPDTTTHRQAERVLREQWGEGARPDRLVYGWQRSTVKRAVAAAQECAEHAAENARRAQALSVAELRDLVRVWPEFVGNAGGFPRAVRDQANRLAIAKARGELERASAHGQLSRRERAVRECLLNVEDLLIRANQRAATVETPGVPAPRVLLEQFDSDDPSAQSVIISLGSADPDAEAWHVDGSDSNLRRLDLRMQLACNHYEAAMRENPDRPVRVVVWSGTDGHRLAGEMAALAAGSAAQPEQQLVVHGTGGRPAKKALAHGQSVRSVDTVVVCGESNVNTMGDVLAGLVSSVGVYYGIASRTGAPTTKYAPGVQFSARFPNGDAGRLVAALQDIRYKAQRYERESFEAGKPIDAEFLLYVDDRTKSATESLRNMGRILAGRPDLVVRHDPGRRGPLRFAQSIERAAAAPPESAGTALLPRDPRTGRPALRATADDTTLARGAFEKRGAASPKVLLHQGLPDDFTRAAQLSADNRRWWEALSGAEQRAVVALPPSVVGRTAGLPSEVANYANDLARHATLTVLHAKGSRFVSRTERHVFRNLYAVDEALTRSTTVHRDIPAPIVSTLALDPEAFGGNGSGTFVIGNCRLEDADRVVWYVDGVNTRLQSAPSRLSSARNLYEELVRADRSAKVAVVCWIGYEAPANNKEAWASRPGLAEAGGRLFARDVLALRAVLDTTMSMLGYSYGSPTISEGVVGGRLDGVFEHGVLMGSPGRGHRFDSSTDASARHWWVLAQSDDPVTGFGADSPKARGRVLGDGPFGLGTDPATDINTTRVRAERGFPYTLAPYDGHGEYLEYSLVSAAQPTESLRHAALCLSGRGAEVPIEPHRPTVANPTAMHRIRARVVDPAIDRRAPQLDSALAKPADLHPRRDLPRPATRERPVEAATAAEPVGGTRPGPQIAVQLDLTEGGRGYADVVKLGMNAITVEVGRSALDLAALDRLCRSVARQDVTLSVTVPAGPAWSRSTIRAQVAEIAATLRRHGVRGNLQAFDARVLKAAAELAPDWHRAVMVNTLTIAARGIRGATGWMARALLPGAASTAGVIDDARHAGATGLAVPHELLSEEFVRRTAEADLRLAVWGASGSARIREILALDVDEIWTKTDGLPLVRAETAERGFRVPEPPRPTPWSGSAF